MKRYIVGFLLRPRKLQNCGGHLLCQEKLKHYQDVTAQSIKQAFCAKVNQEEDLWNGRRLNGHTKIIIQKPPLKLNMLKLFLMSKECRKHWGVFWKKLLMRYIFHKQKKYKLSYYTVICSEVQSTNILLELCMQSVRGLRFHQLISSHLPLLQELANELVFVYFAADNEEALSALSIWLAS